MPPDISPGRKEMELKRVVCPNCGAQIHAKEGRKFMYCEYCGTQIALDDGTQRFEYEFIDRARVKEAENESKRIDERIRDKELYLQNLSKWTRIRNIWLAAVFGSLAFAVVTSFNETIGYFFTSVLTAVLLAGIGVWAIKPKDRENMDRRYANQGYADQGYAWQGYYPKPNLPWYYQVGWIIIIGMFTGGIYWILGPILRINWKNKNW